MKKAPQHPELFRVWVADDGKIAGYEVVGEVIKSKVDPNGQRHMQVVMWGGHVPEGWKIEEAVQRGTRMMGKLSMLRVVKVGRLSESEELGYRL